MSIYDSDDVRLGGGYDAYIVNHGDDDNEKGGVVTFYKDPAAAGIDKSNSNFFSWGCQSCDPGF